MKQKTTIFLFRKLILVLLLNITLSNNSNAQIPVDGLVGYYPFNNNANDHSSHSNNGQVNGAVPTTDRFGQTQKAYYFDGNNDYIEIPDANQFSISSTNKLTVSVWMQNKVLNFTKHENNYVHWMGKGISGQHEWVLRIYNKNSIRPNRTSCYSFNLSGGLGAGSYVEESVSIGEWIHIVAIYNYTTNTIQLYKNGVLKDSDFFTDYNITPKNGTAPIRIGTRDFASYFHGTIDDIRFYNKVLTPTEINELYHEDGWGETVSTPDLTLEDAISLHPNPVKQSVTVKYDIEIKSIEIWNLLGSIVYSKNINPTSNNEILIDLADLAMGFYFVVVQTENGKVIKKFIKK